MGKLLIADAGEEFRNALAEQTRGAYRVRVCSEGNETLETLLTFKPDLLVLDMMLPGLDGITILERAAEAGFRTTVLAVSKQPTDYMILSADRLGVSYMMVKPCDIKAVLARLQDLSAYIVAPEVEQPDLRTAVSNILLTLGISVKLRGYTYLRETILEAAERPGQSITKELYPAVGKRCNASMTQVERSIRSAIVKAWDRRSEALWQMYFPPDGNGALKRPTNSEFITMIAERVKNI